MAMDDYNPFDKAVGSLSVNDLAVLRTVNEGWYIEYKSELSAPKDNAKSISSFANTFGGWLFYGIGQADRTSTTADEFPGIETKKVASAKDSIEQSVRDNVNPVPYFEITSLSGPCDEVGLARGQSIVVLHIPKSINTPHVHSSGRVFCRVAGQSDPVAQSQRHQLDALWQRSTQYKEHIRSLTEHELEIGEHEQGTSFLEVHLFPKFYSELLPPREIEFEEFVRIVRGTAENETSLGFDNFASMDNGYVARHVGLNRGDRLGLTFRYIKSGRVHLTVPFSSCGAGNPLILVDFFGAYKHGSNFVRDYLCNNYNSAVIVDLNNAFFILAGLMSQYLSICEQAAVTPPVHAKLLLRGIWRRIPFLDTQHFADYVSEYGVPMSERSTAIIPSEGASNDFIQLVKPEDEDQATQHYLWGLHLFAGVCRAMGFPPSFLETDTLGTELYDALDRALEAQELRRASM